MTSEQRRVVLTLGFCGLVSAADNWFVSPALPAIVQTLAVAPSVVAVILTAYLVPYGALQPVCGAIGDRVGRVRLLRVIVAGLAAGTLACALAAVAWLGVMRLRGVGEREADGAGAASGVGAFLSSAVRTFFGPGRAVFLIAFTTGIIYLGVYGFMGTFLAERCGLSSTPAGLLMMFYGLARLAGGSLSGRIGGWRGLRGTILVGEASGLAAAGLCTGLIGFGVFVGGVGSTLDGFAISAGGYEALWVAAAVALALQTAIGWRVLPQK